MLFSSITFLYAFLPVVLVLYFTAPKRLRNLILLLASLIFYAFGEPVYISLLIFSSLCDYLHSLYIESHRGEPKAKIALISSMTINLLLLGFFKYADFFISTINGILGTSIPTLGIPLPIGISFFTFQTMSYTIDVYRGTVRAQRNLVTLATFVCLFPQLIAGPIVRYAEIEKELQSRKITLSNASGGIRRFTVGLGKKVLIANAMGQLCEIFRASGEQSVLFYWMYAAAYALQIYFDFSGYSDMAIGLGHIFGFSFPENFNYPYISRSITEFWRRWHMTLGNFFKDYVYIPLGGNRVSKLKMLRNIVVVWLLTGLWHGAAWNFVIWGGIFGVFLIVEKLWLLKRLKNAPGILCHFYVMFVVIISFVVFNAASLPQTVLDLKCLFGLGGLPAVTTETLYYLKSYGVLFVIAIFGSLPLLKNVCTKFQDKKFMLVLEPAFVAVILLSVTAYLIDGSFNPFLYFRF